MQTLIYLVRHGETDGNRVLRYQPYDTPLSATGRGQVQRLAERLAEEGPFAALYASDLTRTLETAAVVGERLGLAPIPDRRWRELDAGDWKGQLYADVEVSFPGQRARWFEGGGLERMPGAAGESSADVRDRVTAAFEELVQQHAGERCIVVSHGWALAIVLAAIHDWDHAAAFRQQRIRLTNTAVSVIEVDPGNVRRCILLNCTRHLPEAALA